MTIDEYAEWAERIAFPIAAQDEIAGIAYLGLGLAGEAGEAADLVKKRLRDGAWDPDRLADELGDVAYYWVRLCRAAGCAPGDVLERSVAKIEARLKR
jgi:NTP pyrophosphatase (non-canonical NTP hydrolase)